jgi:ribosomal protein L37AE/L43A
MAEKQANNIWKCQYCGVTSPQGHWRPKTWIEKHEENCPKKPR